MTLSKKHRSWHLAIIGLVFPIAAFGLTYEFEITVDNLSSERPVFRFVKPLFANPKWTKTTIKLNHFSVYEKRSGVWDYKYPLWDIGLEPGSSLKIKEIKYGVTPEGFTQTTKAQPLLFGVTYAVEGKGGSGTGGREFILSAPSGGPIPR